MAAPEPTPAGKPVPYWAGLLLSVFAGAALLLSFPSYSLWWLAPFGVAASALAVHRRRPRTGALFGFITGVVFFAPLLSWTSTHVGPWPWLLLVGLQAAYFALQGLALALVSPVVDRWRWSWPLVVGVLWVGQEALRGRTPFGGFPWGRLAFSQADAPTLRLAALGGAPLVTFVVAVTGGLLLLAVTRLSHRYAFAHRATPSRAAASSGWITDQSRILSQDSTRNPDPAPIPATTPEPARLGKPKGWLGKPKGWLVAAGLVVGAAALTVVGYAVPLSTPDGPTVTVAIVQGNVPRMGLDFNAQRRAVLDNHVAATEELAADVASGKQPKPDLVIWPENSSDIDPLRNADAAAAIDRAARAIGVPILVGSVLSGEQEGQVYNVGLVWEAGKGVTARYTKQHPVPFAEYMPLRRWIEPIAKIVTDKAGLLRSDFQPGDTSGVLSMGPATIGDVICFEIAYDGLVRDTVTDGAGLLVVQTNNATFNVDEARQQLAMVRLRAVEHGRESLMSSTVGISGFVDASGEVHQATGFFTRDVQVRQLHEGTGTTLATRLAYWPELVLSVAAIAVLAGAMG
ncbi:apolipoprotein N-acyltransferase, partial [Hamadaea sp. NPDC051192]|uniref:apolipoprotein N-acyltransferase n=1 Tax=Hamadaea sp. NPDC051192 TaxID=3154940 RepID=UPI003439AA79